MTVQQRTFAWIAVITLFIVGLVLLRGILLPFVVGAVIAYLLDPLCDWLEDHRFSRTWATIIVTLIFFILIILAFALLIPLIINQVTDFATKVPGYVRDLESKVMTVHVFLNKKATELNELNVFTDIELPLIVAAARKEQGRFERVTVKLILMYPLESITYLLEDEKRKIA